jgi:hypothetical protein
MAQIAFLILAGLLLFEGIRGLVRQGKGGKKTSLGVAIATLIIGMALLIFALFLPFFVRLYYGS